jgi:glycosyltransferase involved in cell wall biosynthesis
MNILVVTAYPPVLRMHGGGVRMFHNIRILGKRHRVRVLSFIENDSERELLHSLESVCDSVRAVRRVPDFRPHWLSLLPFMVREFQTPEMYEAIDQVFREWNVQVLQCEYLQMAQFRRRQVFTILTAHEVMSANAYDEFRRARDPVEKLKHYYRWMQMLRYEVVSSRKFDRVVTMTENDAAYLRSYSPNADIRSVPIGIDTAEFRPLPEDPTLPIEVLFVGNFRHSPNVEAAEFLVDKIAPLFPQIMFRIPGSNLPDHMRNGPNVLFPGYAAETRLLYRRPNTIVAAPLFSGTGQRVKLLEAFAMQCPVITTSLGAQGFPVRNGSEAMIADSIEEFVVALRQLSGSEALRRELGRNARDMIVRAFGWERIETSMLELVEGGVRP